MAEHILNSVVIREKQSAMHILDIAGIDADSPIASEILLAGGTKPEIVNQIKEFAIRQKRGADLSEEALERGVTALKLERDAAQKMREMSWNSKPDDSMYMSMDEYRALEKKGKSKLDGESVCICQRCFRLQQYGQVEEALRPGWSDNELLSPERFETVLGAIKKTTSVVLCLVDVFDLQGSLLPNLRAIAGPNPIVIAANKIDLLPSDVSLPRITDWIHQEIKEVCNLQSPKETADAKFSHRESTALRRDGREVVIDGDMEENGILRRSNIHLVSCTTGFGMEELMANLAKQAIQHGNRVFVMGAANVGKSSFINRMLDTKYGAMRNRRQVNRRTQRDEVPLATVSNLPGTTLDFLKIKLPNGLSMIDTPGLLNRGQLTARLSPEELKQVIPKTKVNAVTLRVEEGKCVLAGGLAMFELTEVCAKIYWVFVN
jgi:ribosome biogenesis GTPase A